MNICERKKILDKIRKLEDKLFMMKNPDLTISGQKVLKELNWLKLILRKEREH